MGVYRFLILAYDPLNTDDIQAYTAFSARKVGIALKRALFMAFDDIYYTINFELGFEAASAMAGQNLQSFINETLLSERISAYLATLNCFGL